MARIEKLPTAQLEQMYEEAAAGGDDELSYRIEAELGRRDYDASDPWSPQNTGPNPS
jgi:hypothetical protein